MIKSFIFERSDLACDLKTVIQYYTRIFPLCVNEVASENEGLLNIYNATC